MGISRGAHVNISWNCRQRNSGQVGGVGIICGELKKQKQKPIGCHVFCVSSHMTRNGGSERESNKPKVTQLHSK